MKFVQYALLSNPIVKHLGIVMEQGIVNIKSILPGAGNDLVELLNTQNDFMQELRT